VHLRDRNHAAVQRKNLVDREPLLRDILREADGEGLGGLIGATFGAGGV
jgi:hypothetical protein